MTFNIDLSSDTFLSTLTLVGVMSDEVDEVGRRIIEEEKFFTFFNFHFPRYFKLKIKSKNSRK